jgi:molybdopterin-guanine dinucleotide biosynthesis protein A
MQAGGQQTPEVDLCHDRLVEASTTTAAAIVAGGRARRFGGQDKSRLVVEGRTIIVRQLEVLQQVADPVFVVGPDPARYADLGLTVHPDAVPDAGALGGIYTALLHATTDRVLVVACDLPFLHAGLLTRLIERSEAGDAAWARSDIQAQPLLACYRRDAHARIRSQIDAGHLRATDLAHTLDIVEIGPDEIVTYGPPERLLANLNTPADYARVQYGG